MSNYPPTSIYKSFHFQAPQKQFKTEDECIFQGEQHKIGVRFASKDCSGWCKCDSPTSFSCVSLCPPVGVMCRHDQKKIMRDEPIGDGKCTCKRPFCVPAEGAVGGQIQSFSTLMHVTARFVKEICCKKLFFDQEIR